MPAVRIRSLRAHALAFIIAMLPQAAAAAAPPEAHDREYWRGIAARDYAVPPDASPLALILELSGHLGSTDPEWRDAFGYEIPAAWIHRDRRVDAAGLRTLLDLWSRNLAIGIGESGTDSVLLRSFSALDLSLIAARDNAEAFLDRDEFERLLTSALDYLARERDVRGYVPVKGWHHSVAHTADLLKFLGRNPKLTAGEAQRILAAIGLKIEASTEVWTWGEDERLAAAVLSLLRRADADMAVFEGWVERYPGVWTQLWAGGPAIDPARWAPAQNGRNLLRALHLQVSLAAPFPARDRARDLLLAALKRM